MEANLALRLSRDKQLHPKRHKRYLNLPRPIRTCHGYTSLRRTTPLQLEIPDAYLKMPRRPRTCLLASYLIPIPSRPAFDANRTYTPPTLHTRTSTVPP